MTAPSVLDTGGLDASREPEPFYESTLNRWRQHSSKFASEERLRDAYNIGIKVGRHAATQVPEVETAALRVVPVGPYRQLYEETLAYEFATEPGRVLDWTELEEVDD